MNQKICILPDHRGVGGPASFRERIITGLTRKDCLVATHPLEAGVTAILVIGGTRRIDQLWQAHRKGTRIVQRLNGMNWVHRRTSTGLRHYLRCEVNNWILATIRGNLADHIVYQSTFTADWWNSVYKKTTNPFSVIHNGVDLEQYSPTPKNALHANMIRLLVVEGRFGGGYEVGLNNAVQFSQALMRKSDKKVQLILAGDPGKSHPEKYGHLDWLDWRGIVARKDLPALYRSAHLLFSSDIRASCPNSVIEALACGLPVVGYDTGALLELVGAEAGVIQPYGSDFSKLQPANPEPLAKSALHLLAARDRFSTNARRRAEKLFDLDTMVRRYLEALLPA
jgi:glycosyltransferase involved in cell wall biosynthesis